MCICYHKLKYELLFILALKIVTAGISLYLLLSVGVVSEIQYNTITFDGMHYSVTQITSSALGKKKKQC
jgi:hypothetical protein